ncbi:MAG: hypothetical protein AB4911_16210 [Oscillochloridaceae bacterium umkhey_bin13]
MSITIIGEFEISHDPANEPALVIHHLIRGYDAVQLDAATTTELADLLTVQQKRIRELGGYRVLFGAGGDVVFYAPNGQRACYFVPDQAAHLMRVLTEPVS